MPTQKPKFQHDCSKCQYLGTTLDRDSNAHDWYRHGNTVVARTGDDGPDYWSNDVSMVMDDNRVWISTYADPSDYLYLNEKMMVARFMLSRTPRP
jgi:hypothetical protein